MNESFYDLFTLFQLNLYTGNLKKNIYRFDNIKKLSQVTILLANLEFWLFDIYFIDFLAQPWPPILYKSISSLVLLPYIKTPHY